MTRLVTFGCSLTFGQALPDTWNYKTNEPLAYEYWFLGKAAEKRAIPSKYAWPQLLADKLDLFCLNLANPASSNKEIWYEITNTEFCKDDTVIILWSWYDRYCVIKKNGLLQFHNKSPKNWRDTIPSEKPSSILIEQKNSSIAFFKHLHNMNDMMLDFYLRCNHVQSLLENKIKLVKHIKQETNTHTSAKPNWNKVNFLDASIVDIMSNYPLALDNLHPSYEAHDKFATMIYNDIC